VRITPTRSIVPAIAIAVAAAAAVLAGPASARRSCVRGDVVARNSQSILYIRHRNFYACWRKTGVSRLISDAAQYLSKRQSPRRAYTPARVAGRFATARVVFFDPFGDRTSQIVVIDARTGAQRAASGGDTDPGRAGSTIFPAYRLRLERNGTVAWTTKGSRDFQAWWMDRFGTLRLLDRGKHLDVRSLRLRDGVAYWTNAGKAKSTRIG
jgi:hypothetical protein